MSSTSSRRPFIQSCSIATRVSGSVHPGRTASMSDFAYASGSFTSTRDLPEDRNEAMSQSESSADGLRARRRIPGIATASAIGNPRIAVGRNSAAFSTSFIHFARPNIVRDLHHPGMTKALSDFVFAPAGRRVESAYPKSRPPRQGLPHDDPRLEHVRRHFDCCAQRALGF